MPKDALRVDAYGTVDELGAVVGTARAQALPEDVARKLATVQEELFVLGAELATHPGNESKLPMPLVGPDAAAELEAAIDAMEATLPPLASFILAGGTPGAAALHHARTVCRRAERTVLVLSRSEIVRQDVLVYLNRLSDYLFVAARRTNHGAGVPDVPWAPRSR